MPVALTSGDVSVTETLRKGIGKVAHEVEPGIVYRLEVHANRIEPAGTHSGSLDNRGDEPRIELRFAEYAFRS